MIKNKIKHIILTPGHGGGDSGAVSNSGRKEADNVIKLCKYIVELQDKNTMSKVRFSIVDAYNRLGLAQSIAEMNKNFNFPWKNESQDNYLLIEVHQDMNAPHLPTDRQKWQIGTYRFDKDKLSQEFASEFIEKAILNGAYSGTTNREDFDGSWQKGHYLPWRGFYLGLVQNTKALSMILECGYISAEHTDEELKKLAFIVYSSFYEMFENKKINSTNINNQNMLKIKLIEAINQAQYISSSQKDDLIYALNTDNYNDVFAIIRWNEEIIKEKDNKIIELANELIQINKNQIVFSSNDNLNNSINGVKIINNDEIINKPQLRISNNNYTIRNNTNHNFLDKVKEMFKDKNLKNSTNELINESQSAIKTKSYKRFTVTLFYFLFTIGSVFLNSFFPDLQFAYDLKNYLNNPLVLTLLTLLTGGYISMQTLTDILTKK